MSRPGALFAGPDGLAAIPALLALLAERRRVEMVALEVGAGQARAVAELMRAGGLSQVRSERDLAGIERVVVGGEAGRRCRAIESDARRLARVPGGAGVWRCSRPTPSTGWAATPRRGAAVRRLYELKGRPADRPAAVMFFARERALEALPELSGGERVAVEALLPGPVTLLLPNRNRRFPLACGPGPATPWACACRCSATAGGAHGGRRR